MEGPNNAASFSIIMLIVYIENSIKLSFLKASSSRGIRTSRHLLLPATANCSASCRGSRSLWIRRRSSRKRSKRTT